MYFYNTTIIIDIHIILYCIHIVRKPKNNNLESRYDNEVAGAMVKKYNMIMITVITSFVPRHRRLCIWCVFRPVRQSVG